MSSFIMVVHGINYVISGLKLKLKYWCIRKLHLASAHCG